MAGIARDIGLDGEACVAAEQARGRAVPDLAAQPLGAVCPAFEA